MAHSKEGAGEEKLTPSLPRLSTAGCDFMDRKAFFLPPPSAAFCGLTELPPAGLQLTAIPFIVSVPLFCLFVCFPLLLPFPVGLFAIILCQTISVRSHGLSDSHRHRHSQTWVEAAILLQPLRAPQSSQVLRLASLVLTLETHYFTLDTKTSFLIMFLAGSVLNVKSSLILSPASSLLAQFHSRREPLSLPEALPVVAFSRSDRRTSCLFLVPSSLNDALSVAVLLPRNPESLPLWCKVIPLSFLPPASSQAPFP